jgi:hypothetical protein
MISDLSERGIRLYINKHRLNSGGYDTRGIYFGTPSNLWRISNDRGDEFYIRAYNLKAAKAKARAEFPNAVWTSKGVTPSGNVRKGYSYDSATGSFVKGLMKNFGG